MRVKHCFKLCPGAGNVNKVNQSVDNATCSVNIGNVSLITRPGLLSGMRLKAVNGGTRLN